jgi:two-component system, cell cycle sensor histidine kinase and response regulator CckA
MGSLYFRAAMPTVLVVDDEEHIVLLASMALRRAGFQTIGATSGKQALDLWKPEVDVLLTDCVMPDLFGDQLAARLMERKSQLKVLFMSGNAASSLELSVPIQEGVNFIQKPFELPHLVEFVKRGLISVEERATRE